MKKQKKYPHLSYCEKCNSVLQIDKEIGSGGKYVCPKHGIFWQKETYDLKEKQK